MELEDVKRKILSGEITLSQCGGKSKVWRNFKSVVNTDNMCVGFVKWMKCGLLLTHGSTVCTWRRPPMEDKMKVSLQCAPSLPLRKASSWKRSNVWNFAAETWGHLMLWVERAFQELRNVGATYGRVSTQSVLPHHSTIYKACIEKADEKGEGLALSALSALFWPKETLCGLGPLLMFSLQYTKPEW